MQKWDLSHTDRGTWKAPSKLQRNNRFFFTYPISSVLICGSLHIFIAKFSSVRFLLDSCNWTDFLQLTLLHHHSVILSPTQSSPSPTPAGSSPPHPQTYDISHSLTSPTTPALTPQLHSHIAAAPPPPLLPQPRPITPHQPHRQHRPPAALTSPAPGRW